MTQSQIYSLCRQLSERISDLLRAFEINYNELDNRFVFSCPVHGGDNPNGACVFKDGSKAKGNWVCWTHSCQEKHGALILGFIKGVLEKKSGKRVPFGEAVEFALKFLNKEAVEIPNEPQTYSIHRLNQMYELVGNKEKRAVQPISRETVLSELKIPSEYFLSRGYSSEVLKLFDVGDCLKEGKLMHGRAVAPVYDIGYNYVGCSGRTTVPGQTKYKWINSKDFKTNEYLYGLWITKSEIEKKKKIVLVEGQGDVWRMYEAGILNVAGIFGADLSEHQLEELEKLSIFDVVVLTDMDEPGRVAAEKIARKCGRRFNVSMPQVSAKDVGELTVDQIRVELKNLL